MLLIVIFCTFGIFGTSFANNCKKEFHYHHHEGYGYDIYCENLTNETIGQLRDVIVYNEIKLTINSSDLTGENSDIFGNLAKLKEIAISNTKLDPGEFLFANLKNLHVLSVQNGDFKIHAFRGLRALEDLVLKNVSATRIERDSFSDLESLVVLNLNENYVQYVEDVPICEIPTLQTLYLQYNMIVELTHDFGCLKQLQELYLDFNSIDKMSRLNAINLIVLNVSYNNIDSLGGSLVNLVRLTTLNLEGNALEILEKDNFESLRSLEAINLNYNKLKAIESIFPIDIKRLDLEGNDLSKIDLTGESIETINLNKNNVTNIAIAYLSNLKILNVAQNNIKEIDFPTGLRHLDLSQNPLSSMSFSNLFHLQQLRLNANNVSKLPNDAFANLTNLEILSITHNELHELEEKTFEYLYRLKILNISHNNLENLEHDLIKNCTDLQVLDVEGNHLKSIEYNLIISDLPSLRAINVKDNLLSCEFLSEMIQYFRSNRINYTINEDFKYDKENVAGIYCKETASKLNDSIFETNAALLNNTQMLQALYNLTKDTNETNGNTLRESLAYIVVVVTVAFLLVLVGFYKVYLHFKRRDYLTDELELIDAGKDSF